MTTVIASMKGTGRLTRHGKRLVAESMYAKGGNFFGAAILLRQKGGYEYVVLHLLCQGLEIVVKALLLMRDYDRYKPMLKSKGGFGHDLEKLVAAAVTEFRLRPLSSGEAAELRTLNGLYSNHLLRYGSGYDILVDASTIASKRIFRKMVATLRLARRYLAATQPSNPALQQAAPASRASGC